MGKRKVGMHNEIARFREQEGMIKEGNEKYKDRGTQTLGGMKQKKNREVTKRMKR